MPVDDLLGQLLSLPKVVDARLSPDGRWVAFVWARRHANLDVFAVPVDGSQPPVTLTNTPEATTLVSWAPDSQSVIVDEDHDGDECVRLFRVYLSRPGEMIPLTEDRPPFFIRGGYLHPDGNTLFYGANYDFERGQPIEATRLYRHDLKSGERHALTNPAKPDYQFSSLNLQGTHLLCSRKDRHPAGRQFHLVDAEGGEDREILNFGDEAKTFARWFPDGENVLVLTESTGKGKQDYQSVGVYHWPSGRLRWQLDDPARSIESALVSPDGTIIVDEIVEAGHRASYFDGQGALRPFPSLPGNLLPLGRTPDGAWIGLYSSATWPTEVVRFTEEARSAKDLFSLTRVWELTSLQPADLAPAKSFHWNSVDGLQIQGWLYRANPNPKRAVIYVHGGPSYHSQDDLNTQIQYLV